MSSNLAVLEVALAPFREAGLKVSVQGQFLVLHDVPMVDSQRRIQLVRLIARFIHTDTTITPPDTHQVYLDGECLAKSTAHPCAGWQAAHMLAAN